MKNNKSSFLFYGMIIGGLIGTGVAIYVSTRLIVKNLKAKRERKHKFYEGIDDIFDSKYDDNADEDSRIDKETEEGIIDELFSRTN